MAKRKKATNINSKPANNRNKPARKPKRGSWLSRLFHFAMLPPVRRLLLLVLVVAILFWQWPNITLLATDILMTFGWGLAFPVIAAGVLFAAIWQRKLTSIIYHWNQWLGGIAFIMAVWGILAFFPGEGILRQVSLGGKIGQDIIGSQSLAGILRISGLVLTGIVLVAPGASFHFIANSISWLRKQFARRPAPGPKEEALQPPLRPVTYARPAPDEKPLPTTPAITPKPPEKQAEAEAVIPVLTPAQTPEDLRQVAQEVWKKYGDSPALVTIDGWRLPPIDILDMAPEIEFSQADNMQRARLIEEALASYGVETKVVQINAGPTVTQFGVEPGWDRKIKEIKEKDKDGNVQVRQKEVSKIRVKVERITSLANNLALALSAPSIRIEAPVPGKPVVGIEVPNTTTGMVSLRGVIETSSFQKTEAKSKLTLALGKGAGGEAIAADLSRMPHLLIAGATGSGKTVCLNSIICCLLVHNTPNDLQFIMVDPKRVELTPFNSIPHLAVPVIVDTDKALSTLHWLNQEMDKRYQKLAAAGARNVEGYNKNKQGEERLPYLVLVIDELADLMMAGFDEVEHIICRLAQLARATGIHLVVATQRPSVDVVTGLIKANFPTRISFAVTSQVDSRTILDMGGAEKLLGKGDMLFMPTEAAKPKRLQGCFVSDAETERLVYFWGSQRREEAVMPKIEDLVSSTVTGKRGGFPADPLLETARQLAEEHKHISSSFLQRRLHIGYPRAARIMEQLEEEEDKGAEV